MSEKPKPKDNSTILQKTRLRSKALSILQAIEEPVILESHGGFGKIFGRCYGHIERGVVFEKNTEKAAALARQRPTWSVYECDSEKAIAAGVGSHLPINFCDIDPYGSPWEIVDGLFSWKKLADNLMLVVNDGLRQNAQIGRAWACSAMTEMVAKRGNAAIFAHYLEVCQELLVMKASAVGYRMRKWSGYYTGAHNGMTHYCALFEKR